MKELPLLLSTEMVLAFLADRKQVTRRIPGPTNSLVNGKRISAKGWNALEFDLPNYEIKDGAFWFFSGSMQEWYKVTPVYQAGDLLWFRETWGYAPTGKGEKIGYKADHDGQMWNKWRPSIHMPKEACRLWAECTVCNCERLLDITEEQAIAEDIDRYTDIRLKRTPTFYKNYSPGCDTYELEKPIESFKTLWLAIHGSWYSNPPVYAINFNPLSKTGRPIKDAKTLSHE